VIIINLETVLKYLKENEQRISMLLGAVVVLAVAFLIIQNLREENVNSDNVTSTRTESEEGFSGKIHTVAKGETLWSIAQSELGSGFEWQRIQLTNEIADPSSIEEGQELVIPDTESIPQGTTPAEGEMETPDTHTVVKGESLWEIAEEVYGDGFRWVEIARANNLANPSLIHAGNVLTIPR